MRVAIIHYWLVNMRGGELVLEALCQMFPQADIFTHIVDQKNLSPLLTQHKIYTSFISRLPFARNCYQSYLPLMPKALEALDLSAYDLVISSESGPSKGIIPSPHATHICYCHSPMRYIWDQYHIYKRKAGLLTRMVIPIFAPALRQWDTISAARVDSFIANSSHVKNRICKYWRRDACVIHPPVSVEEFTPITKSDVTDSYLWVGELVSYKRPDLMIKAFNTNGRPLVVIGGPDKARKALQKIAAPNIRFLGKVDRQVVKYHMARCKALIFPGEEDFGIVPVEVMASGRPVIALAKGGALETVKAGETGMFFHEPTVEALNQTISKFESGLFKTLDPDRIVAQAQNFSTNVFHRKMITEFTRLGVEIPNQKLPR